MTTSMLFAQTDADARAAGDFIGGMLAFGAVFWVLAIAATIFWLWMLIDVLVSEKPAEEKILWFLVILFLHIIGAVIYFVVGRPRRVRAVGRAGAT